jgi:hypothetical protein
MAGEAASRIVSVEEEVKRLFAPARWTDVN